MRNISTLALAVAAAGLAAGCSSTPEPVAEEVPVTQAEPIFEPAPAPAPSPAPVAQAPAEAPPLPGSVADFAYQAGDDRIYFGYDQHTLSPGARETLARQAEWLNTYDGVRATIEGHADERGTREYNLALGARRAEAVKSFLVSQGVAPSRLTTVSYGKERPLDARSSEDGWARNRNGFTNITSGALG